MMKKRLSKTLWYGTDVDSYGNPIIPPFTADPHDLDGLHVGELFLHFSDKATLWSASESGDVVKISGGEGGADLSKYLLISEFNKIWEIRTDSQGTEYIFGKLPVVTQYGITMYSGENVDIPTIAEGLPFDNRTIWLNPTTGQIEVIGGTGGGGSGEGVSNFWDLSGIPLWITNTKPTYSYSEIKNTPDLSVYALKSAIPSLDGYAKLSDIPSLSGYATEQWVLGKGYAISSDLSKYIPIAGVTDITGEKNFTGGLKVNGSPIYYDKDKKYWKIEGDLLVTGGVSMYSNDTAFTPSTIMDAILYDDSTLGINEQGQLYVKGGTGGGIADSIAWGNVSGKPSWITDSTPIISISGVNVSLGGGISQSSLRTALGLGSNAYSSTAYLPLSGGDITGELTISTGSDAKITLNNTDTETKYQYIAFKQNGEEYGQLGTFGTDDLAWGVNRTILHSGNYSNYALPLTGGKLSSSGDSVLGVQSASTNDKVLIQYFIGDEYCGSLGFNGKNLPIFRSSNGNNNTLWHSGNDGSGSGLDADLLDGKQPSELNVGSADYLSYTYSNKSINFARNESKVRLISNTESNSVENGAAARYTSGLSVITNYVGWQLVAYGSHSVNPYYRSVGDDGVWGSWKQLAYLTDNVASATKLQTARTIWGQSFDGTGNVSGNMTGLALMRNVDDVEVLNTGIYGSSVCLGFGTSEKSINTQIDGNNLYLRYGTSHTTGLLLNSSGNISIGSSDLASTNYKLYVDGSINATTEIIGNIFYFKSDGKAQGWFGSPNNIGGSDFVVNAFTGNIRLFTNDTERLRITKDGKIGAGTLTPAYKLDIVGDSRSDLMWFFNTGRTGNAGYVGRPSKSKDAIVLYAANDTVDIYSRNRLTASFDGLDFKVEGTTYAKYFSTAKDAEGVYMNAVGLAWHNASNSYIANLMSCTSSSIDFWKNTTVNGNISLTGGLYLNNHMSILAKDTSGEAFSLLRTYYNDIHLADGANGKQHRTYINGHVITFRTGTDAVASMYIKENGYIGVGTTSPTAEFHVKGNILATGGVTMYSARKLKNIQDERGLSLEELKIIKPTRFTWKDNRDEKIHIGGIADEVMKVLPEVIYKTDDDTLTMDYGNAAFAISASLINPVINHEEEIRILKERIKELEEKVKVLTWNIA